jgi:hypothetical protein
METQTDLKMVWQEQGALMATPAESMSRCSGLCACEPVLDRCSGQTYDQL